MKWISLILFSLPLFGQNCVPPLTMAPNSTQAGELTTASCQLPDGSNVYAFRVVIPVRGTLQLTPKGTGFTPSLIIRDADGHKVETGATIQRYMESGVYTVLVNASALGKFTLASTFTPEANVLCTTFGRLGVGLSVAGTLAATSCKLPDGSLYDGWQTTVYGAGTLTITMHSTALDSFLILHSESGDLLAMDDNSGGGKDAQISLDLSGNQTYTIFASGATSAAKGAYQLTTTFTPDDGETCRPIRTMTESTQFTGSVSNASCNFNLPDRQDSSLFNVYGLHVPAAGVVQLTVPTSTFSPLLLLLDQNGNTIVEDSQSGGAYIPFIKQTLQAGDYSVVIFNEDSFDGDYSLQYSFTAGAAQLCSVQNMSTDQPTTGTLSGDTSCRISELLSDTYRVVLSTSGTIDIGLSSADFSTFLELRDAKNNLLLYGDQTVDGTSAHLLTTLPAGSYFINAASVDLPGSYSLNAQITQVAIPACSTPKTIPVNTAYIANLGMTSCTGPAGEPVDYYKFTTTADGTAALFMTSGDVDSYLTLTDSTGKILRADDNGYGMSDSAIVQILKAGTYKLEARGGNIEGEGRYRVDLLWTANAKPPFCSATALKIGAAKDSSITYTGCQYYDHTFADVYQFQVIDPAKSVNISVISAKFDAFLILTDSKGNLIATDDNSGGGTDANIGITLAVGSYYAIVKPAGDPTQSGAYHLTITQ